MTLSDWIKISRQEQISIACSSCKQSVEAVSFHDDPNNTACPPWKFRWIFINTYLWNKCKHSITRIVQDVHDAIVSLHANAIALSRAVIVDQLNVVKSWVCDHQESSEITPSRGQV